MTSKHHNDNKPMSEDELLKAEIETIERKMATGCVVAVDPETADHMGAFEEDALSDEDAEDSRFDVDPDTGVVLDGNTDTNDADNGEAGQ